VSINCLLAGTGLFPIVLAVAPKSSATRRIDMDAVFLGITAVFFLLTWGFVRLCEKV
jgi:hypothetical protein